MNDEIARIGKRFGAVVNEEMSKCPDGEPTDAPLYVIVALLVTLVAFIRQGPDSVRVVLLGIEAVALHGAKTLVELIQTSDEEEKASKN